MTTTTSDPLSALPGVERPCELVPLFRGVWRLAPYRIQTNVPSGTRVIIGIPEGGIEGRGIRARVGTGAVDWFTIGPEHTGTLDWRGTVETDDGATIYMSGTGRRVVGGPDAETVMRGACVFETDDERYRWLNTIVAVYRAVVVGEGTDETMYYDEYFEVR
jgi:hypothetical protein